MMKTFIGLLLSVSVFGKHSVKKSGSKLMYGCDIVRGQFEVIPEDYNTRWVCAYYKNCKGSALEYFHSNRALTEIYTDAMLDYRLCSVSRVNRVQACRDPDIDTWTDGKCYQDLYNAKVHEVILPKKPFTHVDPVRIGCDNVEPFTIPQTGEPYKNRACGWFAFEVNK